MNVSEGKHRFIESWGNLAGQWGITKAMAQVHAFLLISPHEMTADDITEGLEIARSSTCMNLKELLEWGLITKVSRPGDRRDFYLAERDMWNVLRKIIIERKKRELEPMIQVLDELAAVQADCPESDCFCQVVRDLRVFTHKANSTLDALTRAESKWVVNSLMKMMH